MNGNDILSKRDKFISNILLWDTLLLIWNYLIETLLIKWIQLFMLFAEKIF